MNVINVAKLAAFIVRLTNGPTMHGLIAQGKPRKLS